MYIPHQENTNVNVLPTYLGGILGKVIPLLLSPTAATISTNVESNIVCPGELLVLTCTGQGTYQQWHVRDEGGIVREHIFLRGNPPGTIFVEDPYNFTLISREFKSTLSTIIVIEMNNTIIECSDRLSQDTSIIRIAGLMAKRMHNHTTKSIDVTNHYTCYSQNCGHAFLLSLQGF